MQQDIQLDPSDDITAAALAELERAAEADHETRLQVLEDLYRSLEAQLDTSGTEALG
jgi:hypothetical protein